MGLSIITGHTVMYALCYIIWTVGCPGSGFHGITIYQLHRATENQRRYGIKTHPLRTLIFTGFVKCLKPYIFYRQDVRKYKALWAIQIMTIGHFCVKFLTYVFL